MLKMYLFGSKKNVLRRAILFILVIWITLGIGCAMTSLPTYQTSVIKKQSERGPIPLWQFPDKSVIMKTEPLAGLSGVVKPKPLPSFIPNVEPPFVVHMNILADGSLVCISPLEFTYESKKFVFAKYPRELITRVKIFCLNSDSGTEKWSREISAEGVYDTTEIGSTLLFSSNKFDKNGKFVETIFMALNIENGEVLWQRIFNQQFRYIQIDKASNLIVFSTEADALANAGNIVEAVDVSTGILRWSFQNKTSDGKNQNINTWPILFADRIILFEDGVVTLNLHDGEVLWERKDVDLTGIAQPLAFDETVWFQSTAGLIAIDIATGKTKWTCPVVKNDIIKVVFAAKQLYVVDSEDLFSSTTHTLFMINPYTGKFIWNYKTDSILGNITANDTHVFFSTAKWIYCLDRKNGTEVFKSKLPWDDEFSQHVLSIKGSSITLKNEWNIAMWNQNNGTMIYHHHFEPLCPIMTTQERMKEQQALGRPVSGMTTGAVSYTSYTKTAYYTSQFSQSINNYRSTGDDLHLSLADTYYGLSRASIAQERALAGLQTSMVMVMSIIQTGTVVINSKIQTTHSMVYPQIDSAIKNLRFFDNGEFVVRLVGEQVNGQRFSAIEILNEATGEVKQVLLSPYQMPSELRTIGSSPMTAHELNGYHSASIYLGHGYSTVVDLKRKCIYHYGPGLNVDDYVYFDKTKFARGKLLKLAVDLPY